MFFPNRNPALPRFLALATLAAATVAPAQQPSARNVFWSASDLVQVHANPGTQSTPRTPRTQTQPPRNDASSSSGAPHPHISPQLVAENGYGQQPQLVRVSQQQIGLRYALLLRDSEGHYNEVSPTTIFHSGDHIRISIMANQPGYLYVIQKGSTGDWNAIYPRKPATPDAAPVNHVEAGQVFIIPGEKTNFHLDQNPGEERLFLVLSHDRIADLDGAIDSFRNGQPTAAPAPPAPSPAEGQTLEASNQIPDALVQKLSSRDLTLVDEETVDSPAKPAGNPQAGAQSANQSDTVGEKAVYVVSKASFTKGESPRVVAQLTLRHQ